MELHEREAMTNHEAIEWKNRLGSAAKQLRVMLAEGYARQAWKALGYGTWTDCLKDLAEEYQFGERHMWRLHAANETEKLLSERPVGEIPETQLRPLTSLAPEHREIAWKRAVDTAPEGRMTGRHVQATIDEMYPDPEEEDVIEEEPEDSWDSRLSEAFIAVLRLGHLDHDLYATWENDRQGKWINKLDAMMDTITIIRRLGVTKQSPVLVNERF
jgi:hypothetical protein